MDPFCPCLAIQGLTETRYASSMHPNILFPVEPHKAWITYCHSHWWQADKELVGQINCSATTDRFVQSRSTFLKPYILSEKKAQPPYLCLQACPSQRTELCLLPMKLWFSRYLTWLRTGSIRYGESIANAGEGRMITKVFSVRIGLKQAQALALQMYPKQPDSSDLTVFGTVTAKGRRRLPISRCGHGIWDAVHEFVYFPSVICNGTTSPSAAAPGVIDYL